MTWQDLILGFGSVFFCLGLIPSVTSEHKPAFWTSIITALVLSAFVVVDFSLGLVFAATVTIFTASMWYILAIQVKRQK